MRRIFIFIAFALCSLWQLRAQADTASFLFDKYEDAQVLLRAGGELKSKMNYSIVVNKFYFIDPQDNKVNFEDVDQIVKLCAYADSLK